MIPFLNFFRWWNGSNHSRFAYVPSPGRPVVLVFSLPVTLFGLCIGFYFVRGNYQQTGPAPYYQ